MSNIIIDEMWDFISDLDERFLSPEDERRRWAFARVMNDPFWRAEAEKHLREYGEYPEGWE